MLSSGWRTEQSPFRVAAAEKRVGVRLRRAPVSKGIRLSAGTVAAINDGRTRRKSERLMARLRAALEGR